MYFDAHLHLIDESDLINAHSNKINGFILNSTNENEWDKINALSQMHSFVYGAIGIHPWFIHTATSKWEEKMEKQLQNNPFLMIGEIGIDGLKENIEKQTDIFLKSLNLAKKYQRSVHIHSVKSWHKILPILKHYSELTFLFHRFSASKEIINELNKYNSWYSVISDKEIKKLPPEKVLTETDCETTPYHPHQLIKLVDNFPISGKQIEENFYRFIKQQEI